MESIGEVILGILEVIAVIAGCIFALWWLWQGLAGTWSLTKYLLRKHPWINTTIVIALGLLFGWNVVLIIFAVLICLGPATRAWARHLWEKELRK